MKIVRKLTILALSVTLMMNAQPNPHFDQYFENQTMRVDYFHIGDADSEIITIDRIYQYGIWAGSTKNLSDRFNLGRYYFKIYDAESDKLIYSKGFDSYFGEYQTSSMAKEGIKRTYHETALLPYPKAPIQFVIERRYKENDLQEIFRTEIDPKDVMIVRDRIIDPSVEIFQTADNGHPHHKTDVAILSEGYTLSEKNKFKTDLERFSEIFFKHEPYKFNMKKFNIYGVFKPSQESGVDEPTHGSFNNTALNATFNSLGSERYLLTEDNRTVRDVAAHAPYDALYIMVNHDRYGGGGIYNLFCTFTADNQFSEYLFVHEFGHSFAGLADEYYTSAVAYSDFYPRGIEPREPNITALLEQDDLKWKDLLWEGIEVPTPWNKEKYDSMDYAWQQERQRLNKKIAELEREGAPEEEIMEAQQTYNRKDSAHTQKMHDFLRNSKYWGMVGAFEGAGYSSKGLYRPMLDCIMFSKGTLSFCKVCRGGIERIIEHYAE